MPKIEFGLFRAAALPRGAQTLLELLEIALESTFKPDAGDPVAHSVVTRNHDIQAST
jgi:hypothetical protein